MTMTVKLDAPLERALRKRSADLGKSASVLMREALQMYLTKTEPVPASAFALGEDLFGRHTGPKDLASGRKDALVQVWDQKRPATRPRPSSASTCSPSGPASPAGVGRRGKA